MPFNVDKVLAALSDDFYIRPTQEDIAYLDKPRGNSQFDIIQKLVYQRGVWVTPISGHARLEAASKKKLLFIVDPEEKTEYLIKKIQVFIAKGFEVAILTREGVIETLSSKKSRKDKAEIEKLLQSAYVGQITDQENEEDFIDQMLKNNGENPKNWYPIDGWELAKISHVGSALGEVSKPIDFPYLDTIFDEKEGERYVKAGRAGKVNGLRLMNFDCEADSKKLARVLNKYKNKKIKKLSIQGGKFDFSAIPGDLDIECLELLDVEIISAAPVDLSRFRFTSLCLRSVNVHDNQKITQLPLTLQELIIDSYSQTNLTVDKIPFKDNNGKLFWV